MHGTLLDEFGVFVPFGKDMVIGNRQPLLYSPNLTGTDPLACQGADPILGPPYRPIDYQLFIEQPTSLSSVQLRWTIPSLQIFVVKNPEIWNYFIWTSLTNDINTATPYLVRPTLDTYLYPCMYVWAKRAAGGPNSPVLPSLPVNPGASLAGVGGLNFNGEIVITGLDATMLFNPKIPDVFDYFTLFRGDGGPSGFPDNIGTIPGLGSHEKLDTVPRGAGSSYFWKLAGYTTNGKIIPYNIVALVRQYTFNVPTDGVTPRNITWDAPSLADLQNWPDPTQSIYYP